MMGDWGIIVVVILAIISVICVIYKSGRMTYQSGHETLSNEIKALHLENDEEDDLIDHLRLCITEWIEGNKPIDKNGA